MAPGRMKVYGRKRTRQSSSSGSSADQAEDKSSSTPPLDATITLDDMARKMRRRAARVRRSSSNSRRKSAASSKEFDQPALKRPKLARSDSMQVDAPAKITALSSVSPSERNILAGLSSGPQRRHGYGQTPVTSSMFAKENRDEAGRVLSHGVAVPMSAASAGPGPSSARLASPLRLSTSGDPFFRRRQHTAAARHSYAPGRAVRSRARHPDAVMASFSSTRRRTSAAQPLKKRLSNSWLLSPPNIRLETFSGYAGLDPLPHSATSDNAPASFTFARPTAFSTPTRAKKLKGRADEAGSDDMMQLDEPPAFLDPSSRPDAPSAASSRKTHASVPSPFQFSAAAGSAIDSAVPPIRAPTSPLRYATTPVRPATPAAPAVPATTNPASDEEEQRSEDEARGALTTLEPSPASSGGDELRDMFNVLGLDEDERWTRVTSEGDFSLDLFKPPSPAALERTAMRSRRTRRAGGARSVRFAPPTIKMRTLSSPLKSSTSGSEDELLLKAGDVWVDPDSEL